MGLAFVLGGENVIHAQPTTWYVDADATGNDDGSSWTDAFTDLQDALTQARDDPATCEIWVAEGSYKPSDCTTCGQADREKNFALINGVAIYGGFDGTETARDDRNVSGNETILTGAQPSAYTPYHVVTASSGIDNTAVLDGFTVKLGIATGVGAWARGGGVYIDGGAPTLVKLTITDNTADSGGGMYLAADSDPIVKNCAFDSNTADNGGGLYMTQAAATVEDCVFVDNDADDGASGGSGAAVYIASGTPTSGTLTFDRCKLNNNNAKDDGGGIYIAGSGIEPTFTNCLFYRNEATEADTVGGAVYTGRKITLDNCTFVRNKCDADDSGAGVYNNAGNTILENCILWRNKANSTSNTEADQIKIVAGTVVATNTCIEDIDGLNVSGNFNTKEDPKFDNISNDDYDLDPVGCDPGPCASSAIDEGEDDDIDCNGGDLAKKARCVDLESGTDDVDMGALETPDS